MTILNHNILRSNAERYAGLLCTGFLAGAGTGSVVDLEFEPRRPRKRPLQNPNATEEQRETEPDYSIFIGCAWRLESPSEVVCGSGDYDSNEGRMVAGLSRLVGRRVELVRLSEPGLDLDLVFDSSLTLRLFCDQFYDDSDNYCLFVPEQIVVVGAESRLTFESHDS